MVRVQSRRTINIPHSHVWRLLSDLESPSKYHPMVKNVDIISSCSKGIGATRTVHYVDGSKVTEEVVQIGQGSITFKPKSSHSMPGTHFTLTYSIRRLITSWTEIVLEANYTIKAGLWGEIRKIFPIASTERRLQQQFRQVLEGMEYHLMTKKTAPKCTVIGKMSGNTRIKQPRALHFHNSTTVGTL